MNILHNLVIDKNNFNDAAYTGSKSTRCLYNKGFQQLLSIKV